MLGKKGAIRTGIVRFSLRCADLQLVRHSKPECPAR